MAPKAGGKITREEELLLESFNKNVSTKSSALFYGNAFVVSAIPVWLYWRVHTVDVQAYAIMFIIGTLISTWLLTFAYKNTKHILKHKVAVKREAAVTKEITKKLADEKMSKKEKDERILYKKNEVAEYEATTFSIFYNNSLFLAIVIFASFYVLSGFSPSVNYSLSIGAASGLIALFSTGTKN
eukprot:TRINITY_DN6261_c0_g1_i1.p1 TRINITY_DN6261_c0_g1~~TRINITY_DN6261_c0_g1_i1.p1  ORF type:complete len:184 (-),score=47.46 TRINITY_DN6261_c0_g1_i1:373-924(-)